MKTLTTKINGMDYSDNENELILQTSIKRWGNSQGIRLTKELLAYANLQENDKVQIKAYGGRIIIEKITHTKYRNLKERLEAFYQKPLTQIYIEDTPEVDMGAPRGEEIW